MKLILFLSTILFVCSCSSGGVTGKYNLDKDAMAKAQEAEIAKLPPDQQEMAKGMVEFIKHIDASIELKAGGVAEFVTTKPSFDKGKKASKETEMGKWSEKDGVITVIDDKKELKCEVVGKKITCKADGMDMVFVKI